MDVNKVKKIASITGINQTNDLGRYLGVPSMHGRVTASLFTTLLERVETKLQGWKNRYLSLAGRRILAQSVLSTIPYYNMQTTYLLAGLCDDIERRIRKFLWGSNIHLINWETVTKDKMEGGLGICRLKEMNVAFLAKMR